LWVTQTHVGAARSHTQIARLVAIESDPSAELHQAAAHRRGHLVQPDTARIEVNGPVDGVERVWQREVADAPVADRGAPREHRLIERAVDGRRELGAARAAYVAEETLQDAEVGLARGPQRNPL